MPMTLDAPATLSGDETKEAIAGTIGGGTGEPESAIGNDADPVTDSSGDSSPDHTDDSEIASGSPSTHDDDFWREVEIIGEIAQAQRDYQNCCKLFDEITEERKETKKEMDAAAIRLHRAADQLVEHIGERDLPENPDSESADKPADEDTAWQDEPTNHLLAGLKGLGQKKLDAIVDVAPTAGKLEELRGEASKQCKAFRELLPKGCGQQLADAIENRLVELVAKRDTPSVAEQIAEREREQINEAIAESKVDTSEAHQPADGEEYEDVDDDALASL